MRKKEDNPLAAYSNNPVQPWEFIPSRIHRKNAPDRIGILARFFTYAAAGTIAGLLLRGSCSEPVEESRQPAPGIEVPQRIEPNLPRIKKGLEYIDNFEAEDYIV